MTQAKHFTVEEAKKIGEALGINWSKFDVEQFRMGLDVELEHGKRDSSTNVTQDDNVLTGKIALAHLNEFPDYYTRLQKMESEEVENMYKSPEHPMTATSISSKPQISSSYTNPKYKTILVPHDGSEMSDKALSHAIYLSNMSGAEILILHVLENIDHIDSTAVLATSKEEQKGAKDIEKTKKEDYEIRVEGEVKQMIEEKMRFCKQAGVKGQVSYKIQTGKPVDEIVKMSEDANVDLIVVASSRKPSLTTRLLGSTSRRLIDGIEKPVLIIHG